MTRIADIDFLSSDEAMLLQEALDCPIELKAKELKHIIAILKRSETLTLTLTGQLPPFSHSLGTLVNGKVGLR